jgi:hypothetical protein
MKPERNESTAADSPSRPLEPAVTPLSVNASHAQLESENSRLQRLVAELLVRNQQLREALEAASRKEKKQPSAPLDPAQAPLTYQKDNFSTRIVLEGLRT